MEIPALQMADREGQLFKTAITKWKSMDGTMGDWESREKIWNVCGCRIRPCRNLCIHIVYTKRRKSFPERKNSLKVLSVQRAPMQTKNRTRIPGYVDPPKALCTLSFFLDPALCTLCNQRKRDSILKKGGNMHYWYWHWNVSIKLFQTGINPFRASEFRRCFCIVLIKILSDLVTEEKDSESNFLSSIHRIIFGHCL